MTPLVARDRDTIRRDLLARMAARHRLHRHDELDTREGSAAWLRASALSVILESMERQAAGAPRQVHPDAAAGAHLVDHGTAADLPRAAGEAEVDYRGRLVAWWKERFTSLSPEDLRDLVESHPLVEEAYVFPLRPPNGGAAEVLGCATVIALGPPRGDSLTQTRILSSTDVDHVNAWLQGTEDEYGNAVTEHERRIVCAHPDSVKVNAAAGYGAALVLPIKNADTHPFPFSGALTFVTTLGLTVTVSGDHSDKVGLPMLLNFGGSVVLGGYTRCVPTSAVFGGVNTVLTFDSLPGAPDGDLYPCPPNFEAIRDAVATYIDQLTPYAFPGTYLSRFPDVRPPRVDQLYVAPIIRTVLGVEGVIEVALTSLTPAPTGDLWLFDSLLVTEAP